MSKYTIPDYAQKIINEETSTKIPRLPNKEIDLYIYATNQSLETIDQAKQEDVINFVVKLQQTIKYQPTNQSAELSLDRSDQSGSSFWAYQLSGWIFEQIAINKLDYFFISTQLLNKENLALADKFRLNRNVPLFRGKEIQAYEILAFLETSKSFKGLKNAKWTFEDEEVEIRPKIAKIHLNFDPTALISSNGIQVRTKSTLTGSLVRNNISKINEVCSYIFKIDLATKNPLTINFVEWQHFYEDSVGPVPDPNYASIFGVYNEYATPDAQFFLYQHRTRVFTDTNMLTSYGSRIGRPNLTGSEKYFNQITHFFYQEVDRKVFEHFFWSYSSEGRYKNMFEIIKKFLNGSYSDQGWPFPEIQEKWSPVSENKKYRDLDASISQDRQYMVLGQPIDMPRFWEFRYGIRSKFYAWKNQQNFEFLNKSDQKNFIPETNIHKISFDLERVEFSPQLTINAVHANWVEVTLEDENGDLLEPQNFQLSGAIDPNNFRTNIYL